MVGGNFASYGRMKQAWRLFSSYHIQRDVFTLPYKINFEIQTTREQDFVLRRRYAILLAK